MFREVTIPVGATGRLFLDSMPGRREPLERVGVLRLKPNHVRPRGRLGRGRHPNPWMINSAPSRSGTRDIPMGSLR